MTTRPRVLAALTAALSAGTAVAARGTGRSSTRACHALVKAGPHGCSGPLSLGGPPPAWMPAGAAR